MLIIDVGCDYSIRKRAFRQFDNADHREAGVANTRTKRQGGNAMSTFVMVTRVDPAALRSPQSFEELERAMPKGRQ